MPWQRCGIMLLCGMAIQCGAASAVLNNMELAGGDQGLAITLTADAPFTTYITHKAGSKNATSLVSIRCQKVIYGLDDFTFTNFPETGPVRKITVVENAAPGSFEIVLELSIGLPDIQTRQKGGKWIVLLTRNPCEAFSWSAHTPKPLEKVRETAQPQAEPNGQASLLDVSMMVRDRVERYTFTFDRPTTIRLKREPDRIVVIFVNASSSIGVSKLSVPGSNISAIEIKQIAHGGALWLGASIYVKKSAMAGVLLQAFPDKLVLFASSDTLPRISTWSAKKGSGPAFSFVQMPKLGVDYKGMEQKANADIKSSVNHTSVFTLQDEMQKKPDQELGPVAKSNVNMRQFQAKQLEKLAVQQKAAQMALSKENAIAEQKTQRQKLLEVQQSKKETERIAKEKLVAEAAAKKKADEARARALDSAQHYAAHVKDSIEHVKQYVGPKTVVYHVYGRDPFLPLSRDTDSPVPAVENLNVVGILYDQVDRIGLFEDKQDKTRAYALRENDPVKNGYVLRVQPDKVLFLLNEFGISRTYALKLTKDKQ